MRQVSSVAENQLLDMGALGRGNEGEVRDEVRFLVRQLVDQITSQDMETPTPSGDGGCIILDLEVDGVRCTLVRRPPEPRKTEAVALSPREREIARMVAKGYPNKVIARVLEISSWTVSTHLRRIFAKLGVSSRAAMVALLLNQGQLEESSRTAGH